MLKSDLDKLLSNLPDYLTRKGLPLKKRFVCLNPEHEDSTPSMSYYAKMEIVKCFGCGAKYDLLDLIGMDYGLEGFNARAEKALELYPMAISPEQKPVRHKTTSKGGDFSFLPAKESKQTTEPKPAKALKPEPAVDYTPMYEQWHQDLRQTDGYKYWTEERCLSDQIIDRFQLGYDKKRKVITIPVSRSYYITRTLDRKQFYNNMPEDDPVTPFNLEALHQPEPVFITESAIDAMSIEELGYHALSLNGTTHTQPLYDYLNQNEIQTRLLILALDSDDSGQKYQKELSARLTDMGYESNELIWAPNDSVGDAKNQKRIVDANLMLKLHKDAFLGVLEQMSKIKPESEVKMDKKQTKQTGKQIEIDPMTLEMNSVKAYVENFFETAPDGKGIDTGLADLNDIFYGGLFEGLYAIGGISGGGKTSLCLQIAAYIAEHGGTAIYIHYEQSRRDLMNKLISMRSFVDTNKSTHKAATYDEVRKFHYQGTDKKKVCRSSLEHVLDYQGDLVIYQGCRDIPTMMMQYRDSNPVLIVDYLHIMPPLPNTSRSDSYEQIKANLTMLRQLASEYSMPVLLLCSLNREGVKQENLERFQMAYFRDCGYIEYSADYAFGICPVLNGGDLDGWMELDERPVNIQVVKCRNGSHKQARLTFYGPYSYYENTKNKN